MQPLPEIRFDVASAISQGRREYQEDAIITDFPLGADLGFVVLADGMGGHTSGDVASKIVVTEVFSELKLQSGDQQSFEDNITDILLEAANAANECVSGHISANPETKGMGTTLVAPVFIKNQLFWISVGDSPLFMFRNGVLRQLNEDHSMAPQIDYMVKSGLLAEAAAQDHPDRNCLTSVLIGEQISRIDCPKTPVDLFDGDILIVASDGLQFLDDSVIEQILSENDDKSSSELSQLLLGQLEDLGDPDQDNVSFSMIKISNADQPLVNKQLQISSEEKTAAIFRGNNSNGEMVAASRSATFNPFEILRKMSEMRGTGL